MIPDRDSFVAIQHSLHLYNNSFLLSQVDISDGTGMVRATAGGAVAEALVGVATDDAVEMLR